MSQCEFQPDFSPGLESSAWNQITSAEELLEIVLPFKVFFEINKLLIFGLEQSKLNQDLENSEIYFKIILSAFSFGEWRPVNFLTVKNFDERPTTVEFPSYFITLF